MIVGRKDLTPGTRVRLHAPSPLVTLTADTGVIVRLDRLRGYYIVRLDEPGEYQRADGKVESLDEIQEAGDNLTVIEHAPAKRQYSRR
jgi:hypothetical protein